MTLEELKVLILDGKITREQFVSMAKTLGFEIYDDPKNELINSSKKNSEKDDTENVTNLDDIISRAVDRATNKLGNENKKLREKLAEIQKQKLMSDEQAKAERKKYEHELNQREKQVKEVENKMYALKMIKKAKLDNGDETVFELIDFVMADKKDEIDKKIKTFKNLFERSVDVAINQIFKEHGRMPVKSKSTT